MKKFDSLKKRKSLKVLYSLVWIVSLASGFLLSMPEFYSYPLWIYLVGIVAIATIPIAVGVMTAYALNVELPRACWGWKDRKLEMYFGVPSAMFVVYGVILALEWALFLCANKLNGDLRVFCLLICINVFLVQIASLVVWYSGLNKESAMLEEY